MGSLPGRRRSPCATPKVLNGLSLHGMNIEHRHGNKDELGYLISNHLIRKAAYEMVVKIRPTSR